MTRLVPIVIGRKPTVNLFRSIRHEAPANSNDRFGVRAEWIVAACEFIRRRSVKLKAKALRLVKR